MASATSRSDAPPRLPGPRTGPRAVDRAALNRSCEDCHDDVARQWRGSAHQRAYVSEVFQGALRRDARSFDVAFCRGCHAPEADARAAPPAALAGIGVACVTCHLAGGAVLAAPGRGRAESAPHAVVRDPRFAAAGACAGCHEFDFPDGASRRAPEPMQLTATEHAGSAFRDVGCAACHMPAREGIASHAFASSRDPEAERAALRVDARRPSPRALRVTLAPARVGHAFPTGDLFRRLAVRASVIGPDHAVLASAQRFLARHFAEAPGPLATHARVAVADDRPGAPALSGRPVVVDLDLGPEAEGRAIDFEVVYQRVAAVRDGREDEAEIDHEVVLSQGRLAGGAP
jgi:hypothetical protein